jgi:hypothetical protein
MNTTDEVAKYYYNPKIDKFGNDTNWYNDDYYEMIVVDKTATAQEIDKIFTKLYK